MSAYVGTFSIGEIYVGSDKIAEAYVGSDLVYQALKLPVKTFRFKFTDTSFNPSTTLASANLTWTVANASKGLWDATSIISGSTPYRELFRGLLSITNMSSVRCELIGANTSDMVDATGLFRDCNALRSIGKMDLSHVTNANYMCNNCTNLPYFPNLKMDSLLYALGMFYQCNNLQAIPDLGLLPNIASVGGMFQNCRWVNSGILAMYNILSAHITTASNYRNCFTNCGVYSQTGSAELAEIPSDWK